MKENIVDFLSLFLLNFSGFLVVLITSFLLPFILIQDLIKHIFLSKHINKKQYYSIFSLRLKEFIVSLGTLILFFIFCYFYKRFWYLFFLLPILLGLFVTIIEVIFKNHGTFISMIYDTPLCGTPFIQMEEKNKSGYIPRQNDNVKSYTREEKIELFERMGFKRKNILKHLNENKNYGDPSI